MSEAAPRPAPDRTRHPRSPCIGLCVVDGEIRLCMGCARSMDEITAWPDATPAEKWAIIDELKKRWGVTEQE